MFQRISEYLLRPLATNLPLFLTTFVVLAWETLHNLAGSGVSFNTHPTWFDAMARAAIYLTYSWAIAAAVTATGKRWAKVLAYAVLLSLFAVERFLGSLFAMEISPFVLTLLGETTPEESQSFVHTFVLSSVAMRVYAKIALAIAFCAAAEWAFRRFATPIMKGKRCHCQSLGSLVGLVLLAGLGCGIITYAQLLTCDSIDNVDRWRHHAICLPNDAFTNTLYAVKGVTVSGQELNRAIAATAQREAHYALANPNEDLNVVLVIGESYIKRHAQIYGYALPTTPQLEKEKRAGRLTVFTDAVTTHRYTSQVIRKLLSCNDLNSEWGGVNGMMRPTFLPS